jgi:predicted Zn-dependent protease
MIARALGLAACIISLLAPALAGPSREEAALDDQAYRQESLRLANPKNPAAIIITAIGKQIGRVAQHEYGAPFHYYTTTESDPDAYSYFGPRVYVSVGMVKFAQNREELAGVMCHESAHVLHHDGLHSAVFQSSAQGRVRALVAHHHRTLAKVLSAGETLVGLHYSRAQEENADKGGARLCSAAGSNPWGIVWMLRRLQRQYGDSGLTFLQDHPSDKQRIKALAKYLRANKQFARWSSSQASATKL